ncbi:TonB family protein [Beijerinckia sp. L45]|uniref:cell envelope integrity protein TolA n=1 Tax=Beijerinckia sp. L45 TaxID=1641855 RepID=UPI00131D645E|nr:TonB family protein [Beijerinckia sp. L45]
MAMTQPTAAATALTAREDQRFFAREKRAPFWSRSRFIAILVLVLLIHAALLVYFLYRDTKATQEVVQAEETPIEIVVEPPPPPAAPQDKPKPLPEPTKAPPPPEPPKVPPPEVKEDLSPAKDAPRAVEDKKTVDTRQAQPKSEPKGPKQPTPPAEPAQPSPAKEATTAKPAEDKPDAEALDKATPEVKKTPPAKESKAKSKTKTAKPDAAQTLAGLSGLKSFSIEAPAPRVPVAGGTEDVRFLSIVQGMIMKKVRALPRLNRYQEGGQVTVLFHIDDSGRILTMGLGQTSGNPEIDRMAMNAVSQAGPFPAPPRGVPHSLIWGDSVDGQLPIRGMR